jgi:hypothetical protein
LPRQNSASQNLAQRAGSACYQNALFVKIHS